MVAGELTIACLAVDYLARSLPVLLGFGGQHALILGGVASLILAVCVLQQHPSLHAEIGLTVKQKPGSAVMCIIGLLVLTAVGAVFGILIPRAAPSSR